MSTEKPEIERHPVQTPRYYKGQAFAAKAVTMAAYEDGLMDATQRLAESSADVDDMFAKIHASPAFELESVRKSFGAAMLTASQKEPQ